MNNDILHQQAVKLLIDAQAAKAKVGDYNKRRRDATAALRPVLTQIWEAFDRGETVGGFTGKEAWAAERGVTMRHIQKVIEGPKPKKANSVRPACRKCANKDKNIEKLEAEIKRLKIGHGQALYEWRTATSSESPAKFAEYQAAKQPAAAGSLKEISRTDMKVLTAVNDQGSNIIYDFQKAKLTEAGMFDALDALESKYSNHAAWRRHPDDFVERMRLLRGKAKSYALDAKELAVGANASCNHGVPYPNDGYPEIDFAPPMSNPECEKCEVTPFQKGASA